jgi:hypothetical protein
MCNSFNVLEDWIANENNSPAHRFKHLHDVCLVWSPEVQGIASVACDRRQLDDRVIRILLSGACESDRLVPVFNRSAEDNSRGDHAGCVFRFLIDVFARTVPMELRHRVRIYRVRGVFYVL